MILYRNPALRSFLFIRLLQFPGGNRTHSRKSNQRALTEIKNSTLWGHVHSLITTNKLAELNTEFRVLGVNSLLKKILSAPGARNEDTRLETRYVRKTAF